MTTTGFGMLLGLAVGAVWALAGFAGALLAAALTAVGFLVALNIEGRVDITEFIGHSDRHRSSP